MTERLNRWLLVFAGVYLFVLPTNAATFVRSVAFAAGGILALVVWLRSRMPGAAPIPFSGPSILVPLALWVAWSWLSLAWSIDPRYSLDQLETEIVYSLAVMLIFHVAARDAASVRTLMATALASLGILAALAVAMQIAWGTWIPGRFHYGVGAWSTWLVLASPLLICLAAPAPLGFGGGRARLALAALLVVLVLATARLTGNRMVWIALAVTVAAVTIAAGIRWHRRPWRGRKAAAIALVVLLGACVIGFVDSVVDRADIAYQGNESPEETLANDPRIALWEDVAKRIGERPWTGYGFGRKILARELSRELGNPLLVHAHNLFASQGLQTGLPGLAFFTVMLAGLALRFLRYLRSPDDTLALAGLIGLAIVVGFVAKSQTDDFLFHSNAKEFWALAAMLLGFGCRRERELSAGVAPAAEPPPVPRPSRPESA
ncbi:MAG: O-antigen ligase family protein [Proteobacteria bacterium]|nr:O-antigen ligase family protein [Pseudomonadota bacterium]